MLLSSNSFSLFPSLLYFSIYSSFPHSTLFHPPLPSSSLLIIVNYHSISIPSLSPFFLSLSAAANKVLESSPPIQAEILKGHGNKCYKVRTAPHHTTQYHLLLLLLLYLSLVTYLLQCYLLPYSLKVSKRYLKPPYVDIKGTTVKICLVKHYNFYAVLITISTASFFPSYCPSFPVLLLEHFSYVVYL